MPTAQRPSDNAATKQSGSLPFPRTALASALGGLAIGAVLLLAILRSGLLQGSDEARIDVAAPGAGRPSESAPALAGLTPLPPLPAAPGLAGRPTGPGDGKPAAPSGGSLADRQTARAQASQQADQEAALAAQKAALDASAATLAADVEAHKKQLDELDEEAAKRDAELADRQKALETAAARLAAERAAAKPEPIYGGPTSGDIVWQGPVSGDALITISGRSSDVGQVVSGSLPGVHVLLALNEAKHVRIASAPAPSNGFKRLVLGATGKGEMRITVHWSIP